MSNQSDGGDGEHRLKKFRFKPGVSGNPKGRPRSRPKLSMTGAGKNERLILQGVVDQIVMREGLRAVDLQVGGKIVRIPTFEAATRQLGRKAAAGGYRETKLLLRHMERAQARESQSQTVMIMAAVKYKADGEAAIARAKAHGWASPDFDIHPDDMEIDTDRGEVRLLCPGDESVRKTVRRDGHYLPELIAETKQKLRKTPGDKKLSRSLLKLQERCDWYFRDRLRQFGPAAEVQTADEPRVRSKPFLNSRQRDG